MIVDNKCFHLAQHVHGHVQLELDGRFVGDHVFVEFRYFNVNDYGWWNFSVVAPYVAMGGAGVAQAKAGAGVAKAAGTG